MISSKVSSLVLAFLLALQITVAQPHGGRHHRRDVDVVYKTVYVDQYGNILDPAQYGQPATSTAPPTTPAAAVPTAQPTTSTSTPAAVAPPAASSAAPSSATVSSLDTSDSTDKSVASFSGLNKPGVAYNPYYDNGQCKSYPDVVADLQKLKAFGVVRIYDLSCQQVQNVTAAAVPLGMQVYIGIPNSAVSNCNAAIAQIVSEVGKNWSAVYAISVGNELVNGGQMSAPDLAALVDSSRVTLRAAGYNGPVVTTEVWVTYLDPTKSILCQHTDFVAANCHPFFDSHVVASNSGNFLTMAIGKIKDACPGKTVIITETGWPHQGSVFVDAVPGLQEQQVALTTIRGNVTSNIIYFSSFDAAWKVDNSGTYGTEKYWGIQDLAMFN